MQTEPVVVPVTVDTTAVPAALDALGNALPRPGGPSPLPTVGPAPGTTAADAGAVLSMRAVLREFSVLETTLQRVSSALDRVAASAAAAGGGGGGAAPPPPPGPPGPPAPPPPPHTGGRAASERALQTYNMLRSLMGAALNTVGIGLGVGAAAGDVRGWIQGAETLGVELGNTVMSLGGGTSAAMYGDLERALLHNDRPTPLTVMQLARGAGILGRAGYGVGGLPTSTMLAGEAGLYSFGSAEAGFQLAAQGHATLRSQQIPELLATLVLLSKEQGTTGQQMLQQFSGLRSLAEARGGQYARSDAELLGLVNLQAALTALPNQVGVGQGGVEVAGRMSSFGMGGGVERAVVMRAYMEATGRGWPTTPGELVKAIEWQQDPGNWMRVAGKASELFGPDVGALVYSRGGQLPIRPYEALMQGGRAPHLTGLATTAQADAAFRERFSSDFFENTTGGREIRERAREEQMRGTPGFWSKLDQEVRKWITSNPEAGAILKGVAGVGSGVVLGGAVRAGMAGYAGGGLGAGLGAGALALGEGALATGGVAAALNDLYQIYSGTDPSNTRDLGWGGAGASIGALVAGIASGGMATPMGAAIGYGAGRLAEAGYDWMTGGIRWHGSMVDQHSPGFRALEAKYGLPRGLLSGILATESQVRGRPGWSDTMAKAGTTSATGPFQFIRGTGEMYGLVGPGFDERGDPYKSGDAAARYLTDLFRRRGSWEGALEGYYGSKSPTANAAYAAKVLRHATEFAGDVRDPWVEPERADMPGTGGTPGEVHVYLHLDPGLSVSAATAAPGVTVRRGQ